MELKLVPIDKPADLNFILGQSHFIKTVEDVHETLVQSVPGIKFGLAFCEASGPSLVRTSGTDAGLTELAQANALALSAGHSFIVMLGPGYFPINVLNAVKDVPEVAHIFCATANPAEVLIARTERAVFLIDRFFTHRLTLFEIMRSLGTLRCNDHPFFCGTVLS